LAPRQMHLMSSSLSVVGQVRGVSAHQQGIISSEAGPTRTDRARSSTAQRPPADGELTSGTDRRGNRRSTGTRCRLGSRRRVGTGRSRSGVGSRRGSALHPPTSGPAVTHSRRSAPPRAGGASRAGQLWRKRHPSDQGSLDTDLPWQEPVPIRSAGVTRPHS